jgi:hypothetical protein
MKKTTLTILMLALLTIAAVAQEDEYQKERFTGTLVMTTTRASGANTQVTFNINGLTSNEEIQQYAQALKDGGPAALRKAIEKIEMGSFVPQGFTRAVINIARSFETEEGRVINLVIARRLNWMEAYYNTRSRDYDFSIIQLNLDPEGKGTGTMIVGARLKFNENNELVIEQYGTTPLRILNVKKW